MSVEDELTAGRLMMQVFPWTGAGNHRRPCIPSGGGSAASLAPGMAGGAQAGSAAAGQLLLPWQWLQLAGEPRRAAEARR